MRRCEEAALTWSRQLKSAKTTPTSKTVLGIIFDLGKIDDRHPCTTYRELTLCIYLKN